MFSYLWRVTAWRWLVLVLYSRGLLPDWFVFRSGLVHALEDFYRRDGDWGSVEACRRWLRQYAQSNIIGS